MSESVSTTTSTSTSDLNDKRKERLKKLKDLHLKRNEAIQLNHKEVIEENKRQQLPTNWQKKSEWAKLKIDEEDKRLELESEGVDYERVKLLDVQADDAYRYDRKRAAKRNADPGFSDYEAATARQYHRLVKQIKPDMDQYSEQKQRFGDEVFYANQNTIVHGLHKDKTVAIERLADDVNRQIEKRSKYSRRRHFDDDADIDYINERNMKFNKKLERFYGQYTTEIKQNLERGTAV